MWFSIRFSSFLLYKNCKRLRESEAVEVTVNSKEKNSSDFCLDFVQEFGLWKGDVLPLTNTQLLLSSPHATSFQFVFSTSSAKWNPKPVLLPSGPYQSLQMRLPHVCKCMCKHRPKEWGVSLGDSTMWRDWRWGYA